MTDKQLRSWVRFEGSCQDVEWAEAFFRGYAFSPHRHDSYAVGTTTAGVQSFTYRGATRHALPGDIFVLYPDEIHDGRAGTEAGYGYRILYLCPDLMSQAADGMALPFLADAVTRDPRLQRVVRRAFPGPEDPGDELHRVDVATTLIDALNDVSGNRAKRSSRMDVARLRRVREHLLVAVRSRVSMRELEREHGLDRFALSRRFRRLFGVSPHRFITLRRLDLVKAHIRRGGSLAEASIDAGFADQSHMTRHFKQAFGIPPGLWRSLLRGPAGNSGLA